MNEKKNRKERMLEEALEDLFDCHEDPEKLRRSMSEDPSGADMRREAEAWKTILTRAGAENVEELQLEEPSEVSRPKRVAAGPGAPRFPWFLRSVAAVLLLGVSIPMSMWGWAERRVIAVGEDALRLVVSGPPGVPDGGSARYRIETWNGQGESKPAEIKWAAFNVRNEILDEGSATVDGTFEIDLAPSLTAARRLDVYARSGDQERKTTLALSPTVEAPLIHLSSDKPIYRPGETVLLRAVLLERLSLNPREGRYRFRILDAKGAPTASSLLALEDGVAVENWSIPESAAGGEYRFELRDANDEFTVESLRFAVRKFQTPRLAKTVDLDRESYAPGDRGSAELLVRRVEGGASAGALVDVSLIIDGETTWGEQRSLDASGRAIISFEIPRDVKRGDARLVARITDGGIIETAMEPFVVTTGKLQVDFFPEGGDLVSGVENRVYVEVTDALGRAVHAEGTVTDGAGRTVSEFKTSHGGRGRFVMTPIDRGQYQLRLDSPGPGSFPLPRSVVNGVVLRSLVDRTEAGQSVRLRVHTTEVGPWVAGLFCRGVLVGQDVFAGTGWNDIEIPLPPNASGVLRATVFDAALQPLAERLVQRASEREISIEVRPNREQLIPGDHQSVEVITRDEDGEPVSAVVGLTVLDRSVRDLAGEPRIGLEDQTWFFADVEELENIPEFLSSDVHSPRNIDLVLGTRGWRRFAWSRPEGFLEEHGDRAKALLAREGRPQVPLVSDEPGDTSAALVARRAAREAKRFAFAAALLVGIAGATVLLAKLFLGLIVWMGRPKTLRLRVASSFGAVFVVLGGATLFMMTTRVFHENAKVGMAAREVARFERAEDAGVDAFPMDDRLAVADDFKRLRMLGYDRNPPEGEQDEGIAAFRNLELAEEAGAVGRNEIVLNHEILLNLEAKMEAFADGDDLRGDGLFYLLGNRSRKAPVRVYAHRNPRREGGPSSRHDFTETVYWNPLLKTSINGTARVEFDLSDSVTTWSVEVDAHAKGRVGQARGEFRSIPPFYVEAKIPVEVSEADRLLVPVSIVSADPTSQTAWIDASVSGPLRLSEQQFVVPLEDGRGRVVIPVSVAGSGDSFGMATISLKARTDRFEDVVSREIRVVPRGFLHRVSRSGVLASVTEFEIAMPEDAHVGSVLSELKLYPSPVSDFLDGMEGLLRTPHGCFEQASSANYPNVLALRFLDAAGIDAPAVAKKARGLIEIGYAKLTGYECERKGFEWFGADPGHEALTAYGLLEFHDMSAVSPVEPELLNRTRDWLLDRRDGRGGFKRNKKALDRFGGAPPAVTDAYITYALVATGTEPLNLTNELDRIEVRSLESQDPYEIALASLALHYGERGQAAEAARDRLKEKQQADGRLEGLTTSITSSGGNDLAVETTSFAVLAWLLDDTDLAFVERGVGFLLEQRSGQGTFGATQATITALKSLSEYARVKRRVARPGNLRVFINDYEVVSQNFEAGRQEAFVFDDLARRLAPGVHRVRLELTGGNEFPWAFGLSYRSDRPASDPDCRVFLTTGLAAAVVEEGKTVTLTVSVKNRSEDGVPMVVAAVGLPASLHLTSRILEDLKEAGRFDAWETRGREVILYWRGLGPGEERNVTLDLIARVPGITSGIASQAWLYYTPGAVHFVDPLAIEVTRGR